MTESVPPALKQVAFTIWKRFFWQTGTIMQLDNVEWYLLFLPRFAYSSQSIKCKPCNNLYALVRRYRLANFTSATNAMFSRCCTTSSDLVTNGGNPKVDESIRKRCLFNYKKNRDWAENLTIVMQLGLTMAGCIVFCFFVGHALDKWLGLRGVFTTIFILLGVAGGANVCYRQILEITEPKNKVDPDGNEHNGS